jgi:hypothetical protein
MNDALIKMAFDAGLLFHQDYPPTNEGYFPSEYPVETEDLQKFAELIIHECMRQIRKDENGLASDAIGRIAEYFGVE